MALYKINHIKNNHILNRFDVDHFLYICEVNERGDLAAQFFGFLEQMKQHFLFEDAELNPKEDWIFLTKEAAEVTIDMWRKFWGDDLNIASEYEVLDVSPKIEVIN